MIKYGVAVIAAVLLMAICMVGWSAAGRLMTHGDDISVLVGVGIMAILIGLVAGSVGWVISKARKDREC